MDCSFNDVSKSWFCVFNNPEEHGYEGEPQEICDKIVDAWIDNHPTRTCAVIYCISAEGLKHCHAVLEDTKAMRFSLVKKAFPSMHIEPTKGTKEQAEDYINKRGKFQEKGEQIIASQRYGEIKGAQGQRRDFDIIDDLIQQGRTPSEIMELSFSYRRYDKMIRDAFYQKKCAETPVKRDVQVFWHTGEPGTGKSYTYVNLCEEHGESNVYLVTDYEHGFDKYNGQKFLVLDEFRGQLRFALLLSLLDCYKVQVPCRYSNVFALWNEVHITSVLPPEVVYRNMILENPSYDIYEQLSRRIHYVVYHYKHQSEYLTYQEPMKEYAGYELIKLHAEKLHATFEKCEDLGVFTEESPIRLDIPIENE